MGNTDRTPALGLSLPSMPTPSACPCGSSSPLGECCGPIHTDPSKARTAEQLMRARYSAFALRRSNFLESSWHPSTRPNDLRLDADTEWIGLAITKVFGGGPDDDEGEVAFIACFRDQARSGTEQRLVEHSRFRRVAGRWLYLDAIEGT